MIINHNNLILKIKNKSKDKIQASINKLLKIVLINRIIILT